jgi:hypothetical protein
LPLTQNTQIYWVYQISLWVHQSVSPVYPFLYQGLLQMFQLYWLFLQ